MYKVCFLFLQKGNRFFKIAMFKLPPLFSILLGYIFLYNGSFIGTENLYTFVRASKMAIGVPYCQTLTAVQLTLVCEGGFIKMYHIVDRFCIHKGCSFWNQHCNMHVFAIVERKKVWKLLNGVISTFRQEWNSHPYLNRYSLSLQKAQPLDKIV